jgi:hypothetical protein
MENVRGPPLTLNPSSRSSLFPQPRYIRRTFCFAILELLNIHHLEEENTVVRIMSLYDADLLHILWLVSSGVL